MSGFRHSGLCEVCYWARDVLRRAARVVRITSSGAVGASCTSLLERYQLDVENTCRSWSTGEQFNCKGDEGEKA